MLKRFLLPAILFLARPSVGRAMHIEHNYRIYGKDDGLPSNYCYQVIQDCKGYLWFATNCGVARFNGKTFETLPISDELNTNQFWNIQEDALGRIWLFGFRNQVGLVSGGRIIAAPQLKGLKYEIYPVIRRDSRKRLWIPISAGTICIDENGEVKVHDLLGNVSNAGGHGLPYFGEYKDTAYFCRNSKLYAYCRGSWAQREFPDYVGYTHYRSTLHHRYQVFFPSRETADMPMRVYDLYTRQTRIFDIRKVLGVQVQSYHVLSYASGYFWIKTDQGLFTIDTSFKRVGWLQELNRYNVINVFGDRQGNSWLVTEDQGCIQFCPTSYQFQMLAPNLDPVQGYISAFINLGNGNIVIGTSHGYIGMLQKERVQYIEKLPIRDKVTRMFRHEDKLIVVCGVWWYLIPLKDIDRPAKYEFFVHRPAGHDTKWPVRINQVALGTVKGMISFPSGLLYSQSEGVLTLSRRRDHYWKKGIRNGRSLNMILRNDTIWVATPEGLRLMDIALNTLPKPPALRNFTKSVYSLFNDRDNAVWIGTQGSGLYYYNKSLVKIRVVPASTIFAICQDHTGRIYVSTNEGLYELNRKKNGWCSQHLTGHLGGTIGDIVAMDTFSNGLLLLQEEHLYYITKNRNYKALSRFPLYCSAISAGGEMQPVGQTITLPYHSNNLSIFLDALYFKNPGRVEYYYGVNDSTALQPMASSALQLADMAPGQYTLFFKAIEPEERISSNLQHILVTITPPFWKNPWFLTWGLAGLILSGWAFAWYIHRQHQKKRKIEFRLSELEYLGFKAQLNPHFLFNALSAIQNFILKNDTDSANHYLSLFSSLMRRFLDAANHKMISLTSEIALLDRYIRIEQMRLRNHFTYDIHYDAVEDPDFIEIPCGILQPFVENAINHGLAHKPEPGHLDISFRPYAKDCLCCVIEDNGIGRAASAGKQVFEPHAPKGTAMLSERIEILKKLDKRVIDFHVTDLINEVGEAAGTRVAIYFQI